MLNTNFNNAIFVSDELNNQNSVSVGLCAFDKFNESTYVKCFSVSPIYLKKSQAEQILDEKK